MASLLLQELWRGWVKRLAPYIGDDELCELGERVRESAQGALGKFVEAYISLTEELLELATLPARFADNYCKQDQKECFGAFLDYSKWLLTVVAGLLELYAKCAGYGEVIEWLLDMAKRFRELPTSYSELGEKPPLFERLVAEAAAELKRHATRLYEAYQGSGASALEEAIEWAVDRYRSEIEGR